MFKRNSSQSIGCDVDNCRFNSQSGRCNLEHIEVAESPHSHGTGLAEDESMCASFKRR